MSTWRKPCREMSFSTKCFSDTEVTDFVWEIENIGDLIKMPSTKSPSLHFEAGSTIGLPSKWAFYIKMPCDTYSKPKLYLKLVESPEAFDEVYASLSFHVKEPDAKRFRHPPQRNVSGLPFQSRASNKTFGSIQPENFKKECEKCIGSHDVIQDRKGTLTLTLTFTLFCRKSLEAQNIGTQLNLQFNDGGPKALAGDLEKFLDSGEKADVIFQLKNRETLKAHKAILSARSPVFRTMFQTGMKESSTGVVRLDDITLDGMKILLRFIYCGKMDEKWKQKDHIQELLNASEKYSLPTLKQFFNETLHTVCTNENALDVLNLARLYQLELAENNISYFINKIR